MPLLLLLLCTGSESVHYYCCVRAVYAMGPVPFHMASTPPSLLRAFVA